MARPATRDRQRSPAANVPVEPAAVPPQRSAHLANSRRAAALTRLELALLRCFEAHCGSAMEIHRNVGGPPMSWQDLALLHSVRLHGGTPTLTDMLVFLHRHDLPALQYSFRKLEKLGLIAKRRGPSQRETAYVITEPGIRLTDDHSRLRSEVTEALTAGVVDVDRGLQVATEVLERLIGLYDQSTTTVQNGRVLRECARDPRD